MITNRIEELKRKIALYEAIREDYVVSGFDVRNMRTDAVHRDFCERHPDLQISKLRFTRILCEALGLKSKQYWLDGVRGYFYE